jgi:hypothetical protein
VASPVAGSPVAGSATAVSVDGDPWVLMLQMLGSRRAALGATLNGSAVMGEEERILRVGVPRLGAFQKGQLDKAANRQLIMELISETFGRPLGVRFEPAPEGMVGAGAGAASAPAGDPDPPDVEPARGKSIADAPSASPEGIRRIIDLFGGDVIGPA